jgi:hypothetical protein
MMKMAQTYNEGYPIIKPFYEDAERVGGGRGDYIDRSDYAWNAESMMGDSISDMGVHSVVIGLVGLGAMKLYGQETDIALKHSALLAGTAFLYMGLFGHGLPDKLRGPFLRGDSDE